MKLRNNISMQDFCLAHVRADRALRSAIAKKLEKQNLTMMEWLALSVIASGPKNGLSMSAVAEALDVTLPQITILVTSLNERKFTRQKISISDRRGRQVSVTLKGKRVLIKLESLIIKAVNDWSRDVPKDKLDKYYTTVELLSKNS